MSKLPPHTPRLSSTMPRSRLQYVQLLVYSMLLQVRGASQRHLRTAAGTTAAEIADAAVPGGHPAGGSRATAGLQGGAWQSARPSDDDAPLAADADTDADAAAKKSFPPPRPPTEGVNFSRTVTELEPGASLSLRFSGEGGECSTEDRYGNNRCHYNWGGTVEANFTVGLAGTLEEGDTLQGHMKVNYLIPYSFSCPVCGRDCVIRLPIRDLSWTFATPPCPIGPGDLVDGIVAPIGGKSPTDGIPVHIDGNFHVVKAGGRNIASFLVTADIK